MRYNFIPFALAALLLQACNQTTSKWLTIHGSGLRERGLVKRCLTVINKDVAFLGGTYIADEKFKNNEFIKSSEAILYKTVDSGYSWTPTSLGLGSVDQVILNGKDMLVLVTRYRENSFRNTYSSIYLSGNLGSTWTEVSQSATPVDIRHLLAEGDKLYRISLQGETGHGKLTFDVASTPYTSWSTLGEFSDQHITSHPVISSGRISFIVDQSEIVTLSAVSRQVQEETLPESYRGLGLRTDDQGNLFVIGEIDSVPTFLRKSSDGKTTKITFSEAGRSLVLSGLRVKDDSIMLVAITDASIIGATHKLFLTTDNGRTWSKEDFPFSLIVEPMAFTSEGGLWACGGGTMIQKRL